MIPSKLKHMLTEQKASSKHGTKWVSHDWTHVQHQQKLLMQYVLVVTNWNEHENHITYLELSGNPKPCRRDMDTLINAHATTWCHRPPSLGPRTDIGPVHHIALYMQGHLPRGGCWIHGFEDIVLQILFSVSDIVLTDSLSLKSFCQLYECLNSSCTSSLAVSMHSSSQLVVLK